MDVVERFLCWMYRSKWGWTITLLVLLLAGTKDKVGR